MHNRASHCTWAWWLWLFHFPASILNSRQNERNCCDEVFFPFWSWRLGPVLIVVKRWLRLGKKFRRFSFLTRAHTHTHTHTLSFTHTLSVPQHSHTHSLTRTLSLSHTHAHPLSHTHTLSVTQHSHTHAHHWKEWKSKEDEDFYKIHPVYDTPHVLRKKLKRNRHQRFQRLPSRLPDCRRFLRVPRWWHCKNSSTAPSWASMVLKQRRTRTRKSQGQTSYFIRYQLDVNTVFDGKTQLKNSSL